MNHAGTTESPLALHSNLIASLVNGADECSDYDTQSANALERKLNYQSACTLKALAPLQQVIAFEQALGMTDIDAAKLCREIVVICRQQASEVCLAMDMSEDSLRWGNSYFTGVIAGQIAKAWPSHRQGALKLDWSISLSEIAKPTLQDGLPPTWNSTNVSVSVCATAMNAMQSIMVEYDTFNLFHRDRDSVLSELSNLLLEESRSTAAMINQEYPMDIESHASLMQSLMKNGGAIMASLWNATARNAVDRYQNKMPETQKQFFRENGFPLEDIIVPFKRQMAGMGAISLKTMDGINAQAMLTEPSNQSFSL